MEQGDADGGDAEIGGSPKMAEDDDGELEEDGGVGGTKSIFGAAKARVSYGAGCGGCGNRGRRAFYTTGQHGGVLSAHAKKTEAAAESEPDAAANEA